MPGNTSEANYYAYKGNDEDFIVLVSSPEIVEKWKKDKTIPLVDVVGTFKVFYTHKQGTSGALNTAPNSELENQFGTSKVEDVIIKILEEGEFIRRQVRRNSGSTYDKMGSRVNNNII